MPTFEYTCPECYQGIVMGKIMSQYHTKIRGYPFIVKNALIGVCNNCSAEFFDVKETQRWDSLFDKEHSSCHLTPQEIYNLRKKLDLSVEQFSYLIGCTRQSIYNWERVNRNSYQSRIADLVIKLVRESFENGPIDVIGFLVHEAKQLGVEIVVNHPRLKSWAYKSPS